MPARFHRVNDFLYRGGQPTEEDLKIMKDKLGIERVVSLDGHVASKIKPYCKNLGIQHVIIPIDGSNPEKNISFLKDNLDSVFSPDKKTYIHCYHGKDRTGMACAMFRISKGMNITDALVEAQRIGMGSGLPPKTKKMYYDAVVDFSREYKENKENKENKDSNNADSVALIQPIMGDMALPQTPGLNHMSFAPYSDSTDSSSPIMNVLASGRIYTITNPENLLKPNNVWRSRMGAIQRVSQLNGKLFSAELSSSANIKVYRQYFNRTLLQVERLKGTDAVFFAPDITFILNPNALINIMEEGDSNEISDVALNSGQHSNYDGMAPYSFPGSGGIMESGYGGFGGFVQLPYTKI